MSGPNNHFALQELALEEHVALFQREQIDLEACRLMDRAHFESIGLPTRAALWIMSVGKPFRNRHTPSADETGEQSIFALCCLRE